MKRYFLIAAAVTLVIGVIVLAEDATFTTLRPQTTDLASSPALQARMARALADLQAAGLTNGLKIAGAVTNATTDANVTNSVGLANTNLLAVYDAAVSNFLAAIITSQNNISNLLSGGASKSAILVFTNITNGSTTVPVVLGDASWTFKAVTFIGRKAARTANTGTVYIQNAAADSLPAIPILSQAIITVNTAPGTVMNAAQFYLDVDTINDGVIAITTN